MREKKHIASELIAEGKRLYETTQVPVAIIAARMGIASSTLRLRVKEWGWTRHGSNGAAVETNRPVAFEASVSTQEQSFAQNAIDFSQPEEESSDLAETSADDAPADERAALQARVIKAAQKQMDAIESLQKTLRPKDPIKAERTTRLMASLNKMLKEVAAIAKPDRVTPHHETDDDAIPRDLDEFREALAQRIESFIAAQQSELGEAIYRPLHRRDSAE